MDMDGEPGLEWPLRVLVEAKNAVTIPDH